MSRQKDLSKTGNVQEEEKYVQFGKISNKNSKTATLIDNGCKPAYWRACWS